MIKEINTFTDFNEKLRPDLIKDDCLSSLLNCHITNTGEILSNNTFINFALLNFDLTGYKNFYIWKPLINLTTNIKNYLIICLNPENKINVLFQNNTEVISIIFDEFSFSDTLCYQSYKNKIFIADETKLNLYYISIVNNEIILSDYNINIPTTLLNFSPASADNKFINTDAENLGMQIEAGSIVQYVYTAVNEDMLESSPSPISSNYKVPYIKPELIWYETKITFPALPENIKYYKLYRRHNLYTRDEALSEFEYISNVYTSVYIDKKPPTPYITAPYNNNLNIANANCLCVANNKLFVANTTDNLKFPYNFSNYFRLEVFNDSNINYIDTFIKINYSNFDSNAKICILNNKLRFYFTDKQTPLYCFVFPNISTIYVKIPYLVSNNTTYLYCAFDLLIELPNSKFNGTPQFFGLNETVENASDLPRQQNYSHNTVFNYDSQYWEGIANNFIPNLAKWDNSFTSTSLNVTYQDKINAFYYDINNPIYYPVKSFKVNWGYIRTSLTFKAFNSFSFKSFIINSYTEDNTIFEIWLKRDSQNIRVTKIHIENNILKLYDQVINNDVLGGNINFIYSCVCTGYKIYHYFWVNKKFLQLTTTISTSFENFPQSQDEFNLDIFNGEYACFLLENNLHIDNGEKAINFYNNMPIDDSEININLNPVQTNFDINKKYLTYSDASGSYFPNINAILLDDEIIKMIPNNSMKDNRVNSVYLFFKNKIKKFEIIQESAKQESLLYDINMYNDYNKNAILPFFDTILFIDKFGLKDITGKILSHKLNDNKFNASNILSFNPKNDTICFTAENKLIEYNFKYDNFSISNIESLYIRQILPLNNNLLFISNNNAFVYNNINFKSNNIKIKQFKFDKKVLIKKIRINGEHQDGVEPNIMIINSYIEHNNNNYNKIASFSGFNTWHFFKSNKIFNAFSLSISNFKSIKSIEIDIYEY